MKKYTVPFSFNMFNADELVFSGVHVMNVSEADVKAVAKVLQEKNGGHPVELVDAGNISDKVLEDIYVTEVADRVPEEADLDAVSVELQQDMPQELIAAVEEHLLLKSADVKYYATVNGEEKTGTAPLGLSIPTFRKMVAAVSENHAGLSDFDFLKENAPEAYDEVLDLVSEWAFKECLTRYGVEVKATVAEFPLQVYEYV